MTTGQIILVKKTWRIFRALNPELVGDAFYSKLFTDHPELRRLFPKNMDHQYQKLFDMLSFIVARLDKPGEVSDEIAAMLRRHANYGVRPHHYAMAGDALLWTLQCVLGDEWTADVKEAWRCCYHSIAQAKRTP